MKVVSLILMAVCLAGCVGSAEDRLIETDSATTSVSDPINIADLLPGLRASSCPEGTPTISGQSISIDSNPLSLGGDEEKALTNASFAGAWHLTSDEPNFGGLSGLTALANGDLLTVSDAGAFVWIDMDGGAPNGSGRIGYMRGADGKLLSGKRRNDSEGIDVIDGVAFVSFERDHRILAFDLESCGTNARGTLVTRIDDTPTGLPEGFRSNRSVEAVMIDESGSLIAGLETGRAGGSQSPISTLTSEGMTFEERLARPDGPFLVGLDSEAGLTFGLFRSYAPALGNLIEIRSYDRLDADGEKLVRLSRPYTVDNFEGIAAAPLENGSLRVYIISDDNFSTRQRTLLMAFDILIDP